jgi:Rrf2 family transcriptional regulator, cysteine metabolism repressor
MKLSTRTRYGMRALLDLASQPEGKWVQLKDISARQQISLSYLEHLISPLTAAGVIRTFRGSGGGIRLSKPPGEIRLDIIVEILEGTLTPVDCTRDHDGCPRSGKCATQDLWGDLKMAMHKVLESKTLQDLVESQKYKESSPEPMYYI